MIGHTVILHGERARQEAINLVRLAPDKAIVTIKPAKRTVDQNALMHVLLGQIARAKPEGRNLSPDVWKALFMHEAEFKCSFEPSLDGKGFVPLGFKSSRLNKVEFSAVIEAIYKYAAEQGIALGDDLTSDPERV